mgnify:CR=1 FL=1
MIEGIFNMTTYDALKEREGKIISSIKTMEDVSSKKANFLSILLSAIKLLPSYKSSSQLYGCIEKLDKSKILISKKDKEEMQILIDNELIKVKESIKKLKKFKVKINNLHQQFLAFKKRYEYDSLFDKNEGFYWDNVGGNYYKLKTLKTYIKNFQVAVFMDEFKSLLDNYSFDKDILIYIENLSRLCSIRSILLLESNNLNNPESIDYVFKLRKEKKSDEIVNKLNSIEISSKLNLKVKMILYLINNLLNMEYYIPKKISDNIHIKEKEVQRLNHEIKNIRKNSYLDYPSNIKKIKILILSHELKEGGGVAKVVDNLVSTLNKRGKVHVDVLVHKPIKNFNKSEPYIFCFKGDLNNNLKFKTLSELLYFLSSINYDIIHVHSLSYASLFKGGLKQIKNMNKDAKIIYTCHSIVKYERLVQDKNRPWGRVDIIAQEELMNFADKIIHLTNFGSFIAHGTEKELSNFLNYRLQGFYPNFRSKSCVIPNAIDIDFDFFNFKKRNLQKKINENEEIILGYVGRLAEEKGVLNLAKIFPEIIKKYSNLKLKIIGDEFSGAGIKRQMELYLSQSKNNVEFTGYLEKDDLNNELDKLDILIIPSFNESFSLASLEAFAKRIPVIISDVDGPKEIFINTNFAVKIENPKDPKSIFDSINFCFENPSKLSIMVNNARKEIKKKYNWNEVAIAHEKLYFGNYSSNLQVFSSSSFNKPKLGKSIGLYYGQEFWNSFIHLLEKNKFTVNLYGAEFDEKILNNNLEDFVKGNDIIITCSASADRWVIISNLCKKYSKKHIIRYGGGMGLRQDNIQKEAYRNALQNADLICPTDLLSSKVLEKIGVPISKQLIVPNPVDLKVMSKYNKESISYLRRLYEYPEDKIIITFIGRLDPMRNVLNLVKAYKIYCNQIKKLGIKNKISLIIEGKLMTNYDSDESHLKFHEFLYLQIKDVVNSFGGKIYKKDLNEIEIINNSDFGSDNIIYKPLNNNINQDNYFKKIKASTYVCILPGFSVGSNRALAEALALKRRIITLNAVTNAYVYGSVGIFSKSEDKPSKVNNFVFFKPEISDLVKILLNINNNPLDKLDYSKGYDYIREVIDSDTLVNFYLAPSINLLLEDNKEEIIKLFNNLYSKMKSNFNPDDLLYPY